MLVDTYNEVRKSWKVRHMIVWPKPCLDMHGLRFRQPYNDMRGTVLPNFVALDREIKERWVSLTRGVVGVWDMDQGRDFFRSLILTVTNSLFGFTHTNELEISLLVISVPYILLLWLRAPTISIFFFEETGGVWAPISILYLKKQGTRFSVHRLKTKKERKKWAQRKRLQQILDP